MFMNCLCCLNLMININDAMLEAIGVYKKTWMGKDVFNALRFCDGTISQRFSAALCGHLVLNMLRALGGGMLRKTILDDPRNYLAD